MAQQSMGVSNILMLLPAVIISVIAYNYAKEEKIDANTFLLFLSALSPILGLICYFARQDVDKKAANVYLTCTGASFIVGVVAFIFI